MEAGLMKKIAFVNETGIDETISAVAEAEVVSDV